MIDELSTKLAAWLMPRVARDLLERQIGNEIGFLDALAGPHGLDHRSICKGIAACYGADILFNSDTRHALIARISDDAVEQLYTAFRLDVTIVDPARRRTLLQSIGIGRGSYKARRLCELLDFPTECAGDTFEASTPGVDRFPPRVVLPPLHEYQTELASQIREELLDRGGDRRAMLALPTGCGKTRVVLDTYLNWEILETGSGTLLWVAQHAELCEQAIECIAQIWASRARPRNRQIVIQRVWGGKSEDINWNSDVIVAIPESLTDRLIEDQGSLEKRLRGIVIDEAHLAVSEIYDPIWKAAGLARVPVLGVSATPANSGRPGVLRQCFDDRLLRANSLGSRPYVELNRLGILSSVEFEKIASGITIPIADEDRETLRKPFTDYGKAILGRLGRSARRNRVIVERLLQLPRGVQTLCFTSSVESAHALAAALSIFGREASAIDSGTQPSMRRRILDDFKSGETQFLFNYAVLATGFDAPQVACVLLARPTRSLVLLEQMLGRGLRGPKNGGTESCRILWIEDDFANAEELRPQSYQRFAGLWKADNE